MLSVGAPRASRIHKLTLLPGSPPYWQTQSVGEPQSVLDLDVELALPETPQAAEADCGRCSVDWHP